MGRAKKIRVFYKPPGMPGDYKEIPNTLKALQKLVGGFIEVLRVNAHTALICDEEGKFKDDYEPNLFWGMNDCIYGPLALVGVRGEEFCDLTMSDEEIMEMMEDVV